MKKIMIAGCIVLAASQVQAQQEQGKAAQMDILKQGKILYEHTVQLRIRIDGLTPEMQNAIPRSRTNRLEVLFGNNQSLRRAVVDDIADDAVQGMSSGGASVQFRTMGGGANDIVYTDLGAGIRTQQTEFAAKTYIITDTVIKLPWKLTGDAKVILNYPCQKAVAQVVGKRTNTSIVDGKAVQEQVADTSNIEVWFTGVIPVSAGPEYMAQLPGAILEIDINNGRDVYKAIEVSPKIDVASIKEPKNGKKISKEEFTKEREKLMKEMQSQMQIRNGSNGTMMFRAN